jgi:hypothetical protein
MSSFSGWSSGHDNDWLDVLVVLVDEGALRGPNWPPTAYVGKSLATGGKNVFVLQNEAYYFSISLVPEMGTML